MRLFLLRHAEAVPGHPDEARPLSAHGREVAAEVGRWLGESSLQPPATLFHSPYRRARETAELVVASLPAGHRAVPQERPGITPDDPLQPWLRLLGTATDDLFLVAHNPFVTKLAASLLRVASDMPPFVVEPATLLLLERRTAPTPGGPGAWDLVALLPGEALLPCDR